LRLKSLNKNQAFSNHKVHEGTLRVIKIFSYSFVPFVFLVV
jgi:hypothetical protein